MFRSPHFDFSISKVVSIVVLLGLHCLSGSFEAVASQDPELKEILVIHSKDPLNEWSRGISDRMRERLADSWTELSIEYLDYREHGSNLYRKSFREYLKVKYTDFDDSPIGERLPAAVVPIGSGAIDFVAEYRDELFPGIPVVFSGPMTAPDVDPWDSLFENATGTINGVDYAGNVALARQLHPERDRVFILFENSTEGAIQGRFASDQLATMGNSEGVEILLGSDWRTADLIEHIRSVEDRAMVVYMSWGIDADGMVFQGEYGRDRINKALNVPIYTVATSRTETGVAGGMMVFPAGQADATIDVLEKVLEGVAADSMEPVINLKSKPVIEYSEMQRWNVPEKRWPLDAEVRNRPRTLWTEYRGYVISAVLIVVFQGIAVVSLLFVLKFKRSLAEERRVNELELGRANSNLEKTNTELEENLVRARQLADELEKANQAKVEFLAMVSHELRTPLNPIIGYADLLSSELDDKEQLDSLNTIRRASSHLLELIETILDFSKASSPYPAESKQTYHLGEMLEEVAALFRGRASDKGIGLTFESKEQCAFEVAGDRHALMQVMINLVSNAVKFTDEGLVTIRHAVGSVENGHSLIVLEVADTGKGIAPEFKKSVFTPFTQEDVSMSRKHQGIGLGLAISKKIVENLGGSITFESELGKGAVFRLEIPFEIVDRNLESESESGERKEDAGIAVENGSRVNGSDARFLIVDDHPENRSLMADVIRREGWTFAHATNGSEAIQLFEEQQFSLILMDVRMPGVSGIQATQAIRKRGDRGRRVPIIAMTAHDNVEVRQECILVGMNDFVLKPIKIRETLAVIKKWLQS